MMKKSLLLLMILFVSVCSASEPTDKPYEKIYYKDKVIENDQVTITITDGISTAAYIKYKIRVKNKTSDYILLNTDNIILKAAGKEYTNIDKDLLIGPNDEESKVVDIKGTDLRFDKFTLELKGFSRISATSGEIKAENFKLPIVKNEFIAGPFKLVQMKLTKKTDAVIVKFSVDYTGDQIGIVHPGKASLLTPKGTEFANMASRGQRSPDVLKKGQNHSFVLVWKDIPVSNGDMQKENIEILWHDCFRNSVAEPFSVAEAEVEIDKVLSDSKNKR